MNKNKKIFLILAVIFLIIIIWIGLDISSRTTFPWRKDNMDQRLNEDDSVPASGNLE